tara:strand:+ start:141 stop:530 length:390 start_codon:yes stop_codon:yes gene_type:complete
MKEIELENNAFLISKTDKKGIVTYSNISFQDATGYSEKEIIGKSYREFLDNETPKEVIKELWEKVNSGKSWQGIIKITCLEKNYFWVDSLISPSYMEDEMIGFLLIKRKASKDQIEEAQEKYAQFIKGK